MNEYESLISAAHSGAYGMNELARPTIGQLRAGNYRKGRFLLHGMPVAIETPQGQRREGKEDGMPWSVICQAHYGYLIGTKASDGDEIDVYIGPIPESYRVFVINQNDKAGNFDEVKVMLGFIDEDSARAAYMNSYERGWTGLGSLVTCSIDQLKWWLKYGNTTIPLTDRALPHDGTAHMNEILWDSAAQPIGLDMADVVYQLRRTDGEGLMLDAVTLAEIMEDSDGEEVLDALVVEYVKAERKAEQLMKIMASMGGDVKPVAVQLTPPFKQRGTTNVVMLFELSDGQTVSIWFHNPDSTPNRILPNDELVSWSWRLNKKDVSILVAPEKGLDLNPREVARRIMNLAQRNSARFAKANATRAQRMESIEGLKGAVASKEAALASLDALFSDLTEKVQAKRALPPKAMLQTNDQLPEGWTEARPGGMATNRDPLNGGIIDKVIGMDEWFVIFERDGIAQITGLSSRPEAFAAHAKALAAADAAPRQQVAQLDPTTPEGYAIASQNEDLLIAHQDQLDHFFGGRLVDVRNALRDLGWESDGIGKPLYVIVGETQYQQGASLRQVGAGANVVGVTYRPFADVNGQDRQPKQSIRDDLSKTASELAQAIQSAVDELVAARIGQPPLVAATQPARMAWEDLVYEAIEARGITRSDAQGIVEAQGAKIGELFASGASPVEAASAFLGEPEPVQAVASPVPAVAAAATAELVAQAAATGDDTELTAAKAFLQSVIDGNVDYYDADLVGKLEAIHDAYTDIDEVMALFNLAAQAFSDYMVEQTRTVL